MAKNPQADRNWREPIRKSEVATDFGISLARISGIFLQLRPARAKSQEPKLRLVWRFAGCKIRPKSVGFPIIACSLHCAVKSAKKKGVSTSTVWGGTATRNYHSLTHRLEHLWKVSTCGARVEIRQYDRSLAGADYVCKCLGANAYELNKYSFANTVTLSASVIRLIAGIDASGDRRCGRDTC